METFSFFKKTIKRGGASPTPSEDITLQQYIEMVRTSPEVKTHTEQVRQHPYGSEEYKEAKTQWLWTISPHARVTARKNEAVTERSGLFCFDIDMKDNKGIAPDEIRAIILELDFVKALHTTASGGLAFFVETNADTTNTNPAEHLEEYKFILNWIQQQTGITLDASQGRLVQPRFVTHDPEAEYFGGATIVDVTGAHAPRVEINSDNQPELPPEPKSFDYPEAVARGVLNWARENQAAIADSYDDWFHGGFALTELPTREIFDYYFHEFSKLSPKYDLEDAVFKADNLWESDQKAKLNGTKRIGVSFLASKALGAGLRWQDMPRFFGDHLEQLVSELNQGREEKGIPMIYIAPDGTVQAKESDQGEVITYDQDGNPKITAKSPIWIKRDFLIGYIKNDLGWYIDKITGELMRPATPVEAEAARQTYEAAVSSGDTRTSIKILQASRPVDNEDVNGLHMRHDQNIHRMNIKKEMVKEIIVADVIPRRNVPVEYIEGLEWDGVDWIKALASTVQTGDTRPDLWESFFRTWIVGMINNIMRSDSRYQTIEPSPLYLLLHGKGNTGKSYFFRAMLPPELIGYLTEFSDKPDDYTMTTALMSSLLVIDDEARWLTEHPAKLKAVTSQAKVTLNKKYEAKLVQRPRIATFCGTSNESVFLQDQTGNRRFIPIQVTERDWEQYDAVPKDQLIAQAFHLWRTGYPVALTIDQLAALQDLTEAATDVESIDEIIGAMYKPMSADTFRAIHGAQADRYGKTATQLVEDIALKYPAALRGINKPATQVKKALRRLGFVTDHRMSIRDESGNRIQPKLCLVDPLN